MKTIAKNITKILNISILILAFIASNNVSIFAQTTLLNKIDTLFYNNSNTSKTIRNITVTEGDKRTSTKYYNSGKIQSVENYVDEKLDEKIQTITKMETYSKKKFMQINTL